MKTILIVEDDLAIARGVCDNLEREGYRVLMEKDGLKGYERAKFDQPDLMILDVMLPSMDGFQICSLLKKEGFGAPIFLLTGLTQERSRLEGLWQGADDYIAKPFSIQELILRVRNALKQREGATERTKILEAEFLKARKIQMASLPRKQPRVAGLEIYGKTLPAMEVGGDYFDYLQLDKDVLGVIVADVSGKGMPAAMYVQKMQGIVQTSREKVAKPEDVLRTLQQNVHETMDSASFITAVVALFDVSAGTIQIAQAGHLPVLFARKNRIRLWKPEGVWIGKSSAELFGQKLCSEQLNLQLGDLFLFYSDGLIEAKDKKGKEFGIRRLKKFIVASKASAKSLVEQCFKEVKMFTGTQPQFDDITVVAVKVVNHHSKQRNDR